MVGNQDVGGGHMGLDQGAGPRDIAAGQFQLQPTGPGRKAARLPRQAGLGQRRHQPIDFGPQPCDIC